MPEDQPGQACRNPFLIEAPFFYRALMDCPFIGCIRQKGIPPEDKREHLQPMAPLGLGEGKQAVVVAGDIEHNGKIDLEELFRN